jgi:hypothetical protein
MAMEGRTTCAIRGCTEPISGHNNLCNGHRIPGGVVRVGKNTMVITAWAAEHGNEFGIVLANDFALGEIFGGRAGFEARLKEQGFTNVRNLETPEELETARSKSVASWSGSWRAQYPWQKVLQEKERGISDLGALILTNVFGPEPDGVSLMALVYRDGTIRLKYPDGDAANIDLQDRVETPPTLDDLIEMAEKSIRAYCSTVTPKAPRLTVHRMPEGVDEEAARKWLESLPGVQLVEHSEPTEGLGGHTPSAGQAG